MSVDRAVESPTAFLAYQARVYCGLLTGTHQCDDPPKQDGGSPERQHLHCVVASACVVVLLCGRHVRRE